MTQRTIDWSEDLIRTAERFAILAKKMQKIKRCNRSTSEQWDKISDRWE